jgi:hypothetical protein
MAFPKSQSIIVVYGIGRIMQNHAKKWFNNRSSTNAMAAIAIGAMLVFSVAGMKGAFADTIENTIAADVTRNTIDAGGTTTATYYVKQESAPTEVSNSGDAEDNEATPMDPEPPIGNNGCNAQDGTRLSIDVNFPSGVRATIDGSERASPITLTFDKCGEGNGRQITFSSNAAGSYQITTNNIRDNGIGLYTDNSDFTLTVRAPSDTTKPELNLPSDITEEATGPEGRVITYTATATDNGKDIEVNCTPASGSTFKLGETTVNCSATDAAGNEATGSFKVTITPPADRTAPELNLPSDITEEATGPGGAAITYTATATDNVDGDVEVTCEPPSGSTFKLGETTVNCSATDAAQNTATGSFTVTVQDTKAPTLTLPADISQKAKGASGNTITYTATATDIVDGTVTVTCTPASGSTFPIGTTTVNCSVKDAAGNEATGSFKIAVTITAQGFYQPVDNLPTLNSAKAGQTIPIKFEVFGESEITATSVIVQPLTYKKINCDGSAPSDAIETVATGSTVLRYDSTAGQFIYNWKTPNAKGCYEVNISLIGDMGTKTARFDMR